MDSLKTIHPRCAGMTNLEHRFRREAWALAAIEHPGPPTLFESSVEPEPFFTMEIVEGTTLAAVLRQGKLDPHRALCVAIDLARILHAAHEVGAIHRDVKPDNILLDPSDRVRLLDSGACLLMPRFHQRHLLFPATPPEQRYATGDLETVGTPGYTAPEILELRGGVGPRSDIYSVCAVLYEMLTGRRYESPSGGQAQPIERGEFSATLGPIADVLRRGVAREPSERPWSMADLVRSLEIVRAGLLGARRRQQLLVIAVLAVMSTAAIAGITLRLTSAGDPAPTIASPAVQSVGASPIEPVQGPNDYPSQARVPDPAPPLPPASPTADIPAHTPAVLLNGDAAANEPALLTTARVRSRLTTRRHGLEQCGAPLLVLNLTIEGRHPVLSTANGMTEGDPLHACVREALRGLTFPLQRAPQTYTVTLNLGPGAG
jgi:serine/threonine protein kinase